MYYQRITLGAHLEFKALVFEYLGLDPDKLAAIDTETNSVAGGLNNFMRKTLERAIRSVWAPDGAVFQLRTDDAAKALGWPDAATHDLSELFAYALVRAARKARGLPYMPLCPADGGAIISAQEESDLWTAAECAAVAKTLLMDGVREMRDAHGLEGAQPMSVCALVKKRLGLRPKYLVQSLYTSGREASLAYGRDPEGQTVAALAILLLSVLETFQAAVASDIEMISLLITDPSCGGGARVRQANFFNVLVAGLLAEPEVERDLGFLVKTAAPAGTRTVH